MSSSNSNSDYRQTPSGLTGKTIVSSSSSYHYTSNTTSYTTTTSSSSTYTAASTGGGIHSQPYLNPPHSQLVRHQQLDQHPL
ncbi:hypothetical protein HUG17_3531 [Dermatophagoides farinae]|uniref:Uncharacterized protein n=1 Tax=Dermatophagoides farinae TaxID=6954 RepID=A0A9D4NW76_DERFA|nr:hypothetical protein HUG17_3531 [Dermatophagoides farinae]